MLKLMPSQVYMLSLYLLRGNCTVATMVWKVSIGYLLYYLISLSRWSWSTCCDSRVVLLQLFFFDNLFFI